MNEVSFDPGLFAGLDDKEIKSALRSAAREASVPVFQRHYSQGQGEWPANDPDYARAKAGSEKFFNTGDAKRAIDSKYHKFKKVRVSKRGQVFRATVALSRMKDGVNVYAVAQRGKTGREDDMEISAVRPGDESIVVPIVEAAVAEMLTKKGLL